MNEYHLLPSPHQVPHVFIQSGLGEATHRDRGGKLSLTHQFQTTEFRGSLCILIECPVENALGKKNQRIRIALFGCSVRMDKFFGEEK